MSSSEIKPRHPKEAGLHRAHWDMNTWFDNGVIGYSIWYYLRDHVTYPRFRTRFGNECIAARTENPRQLLASVENAATSTTTINHTENVVVE